MEWRQRPGGWGGRGGGFGGGGFGGGFGGGSYPVPRDVIALLAVIFVTFSLRFFESTRLVPEFLALTPAVYRLGFLWQLVTYPFVGLGSPGIWFLVELLILFWFARSVFYSLGQRKFWKLVAMTAFAAALVAVGVDMLGYFLGSAAVGSSFILMQGQRMMTVIMITAFAVLYRNATILLFFVLPIQARWFIWIELLFAFMGFLGTRDLAGFLGLVTAVAVTYNLLVPGSLLGGVRTWWLRLAHKRHESELKRLRRKRGFRVVKDEDDEGPTRGPWVN